MNESALVYRAAQTARALSLPEQIDAPSPAREAFLESFRQRNAFLDYLFYDVGVVTADEARRLAPRWAAEGAILVVPPSGLGAVQLCPGVDAFVQAGGAEVSTLVVAGVGSSALGSAAFARNVADALGRPVAAIVSGYGLADVATEALGGFFWFGMLNHLRHSFERIDEMLQPKVVQPVSEESVATAIVRLSRDTQTVLALLRDPRLSFDLLAGHSKGNLVLSEALYELREQDALHTEELAKRVKIVTVSARIAMPLPFTEVIDIMGGWDWFGGLNSRPDIEPDHIVPNAWHHTNTEIPFHLPVVSSVRAVLARHSA
jgi:hypothetical protein